MFKVFINKKHKSKIRFQYFCAFVYILRKMLILKCILWSWRESNPRPNRETLSFLHAYSGLNFRALTRPGPPISALSPKVSLYARSNIKLFPIYRTAESESFGTTASGRCLVPLPCNGIKPRTYYTSVRQRERNCFRQIKF